MSTVVPEMMAVKPIAIRGITTDGSPGRGIDVWPPVVLAPMAGVTNAPFRSLCRSFGPGLVYVNEMIMAAALVYGNSRTRSMVTFAPDERFRSMQLYGSDPAIVERAVDILGSENLVDHIDLNFGCPAAKVTRKGGGAAVPLKKNLLSEIVRAAVRAGSRYGIPVTCKFRMGINEELITFIDTGKICRDAGAVTIALHARTAQQHYAPSARWEAIAELKQAVGSIPVLGNGDIWEASDAVRMVNETGCDGVVIGRGCLGRPWLFAELTAALAGQPAPSNPTLGEIVATMVDHLDLLCEHTPSGGRPGMEATAVRDFRKHVGWYLQAVPVGSGARRAMMAAETRDQLVGELHRALDTLGAGFVPDPVARRQPRGHTHGPRPVALPPSWLDHPDDPEPPAGADSLVSGG